MDGFPSTSTITTTNTIQPVINEGWQPPSSINSIDNINIEKLTPLSQSFVVPSSNNNNNTVPFSIVEHPLVEREEPTATVTNKKKTTNNRINNDYYRESKAEYTKRSDDATYNRSTNQDNPPVENYDNVKKENSRSKKEKQRSVHRSSKPHHHHHYRSRPYNDENDKHTSRSRKHRSSSRRSIPDSSSHRSSSIRSGHSYDDDKYTITSSSTVTSETSSNTNSDDNDSLSYTSSSLSQSPHRRKHHSYPNLSSSSYGVPLSQSALQGPPIMIMNNNPSHSGNNGLDNEQTALLQSNISSLATIGSLIGWNNNNNSNNNTATENINLHTSMLESSSLPNATNPSNSSHGIVEIPMESLRMMNRNTLALQEELNAVTMDRDNLISRCDILTARLAQAESDMEKERNAYRNDLSRMEGTVRGKEEIITLLNNQLTSMQGQVVQLASNNGNMMIPNTSNNPVSGGIPLSISNSGVTEEDFVLLSEEVQDLQQQLNQARQLLVENGISLPNNDRNDNPLSSVPIDNNPYSNATLSNNVLLPGNENIDQSNGTINYSPKKMNPPILPSGANSTENSSNLPASPVVSQRRRGGLSYDDLANENTRLKQQLVAAQEETSMLRAAQIGIDATKETLETKLRTKEEQFHRLQDTLDTTKNQVTEMDKEIKRLSVTLLTSENESDKLRRRATAAEERIEVQLRTIDQLQTNIRTYQNEINELKTNNASKVREIDDLRNQIRQKIQEIGDTKQEIQNMRDTVRQLQHELSAASTNRSAGTVGISNRPSISNTNNNANYGTGEMNNNNSNSNTTKQRNTHNNNYTSNNWFSSDVENVNGSGSNRTAVPEPVRMGKPNLDTTYYPSSSSSSSSSASIASPTRHSANSSYTLQNNNRIFGNEDSLNSNNNGNLSSVGSSFHNKSIPSTPMRNESTKPVIAPGNTSNITSKNENIPPPYAPVPHVQPSIPKSTVTESTEPKHIASRSSNNNSYTASSNDGTVNNDIVSKNSIHSDPFPPILPRNEPLPTYPFNPTTIPPVPIPSYPPVPPVNTMMNKFNPSVPSTLAPAPVLNERARRMAMLADIASSASGNTNNTNNNNISTSSMVPSSIPTNMYLPNPLPYRPSLGGGGLPTTNPSLPVNYRPSSSSASGSNGYGAYDSYAIASIQQQDPNILNPFPNPDPNPLLSSPNGPYRRIGGNKLYTDPSSTNPETIEDALPFSSIAHRKQEEDDKLRELSRLSKQEADSLAKDREAAAPFATEASVASLEIQIAEKEERLLKANQSKTSIDNELKAIGPSARTVKDRQRKVELEALRENVEKELSEVRRWLKTNVVT